jgi:hypothetical protein
MSRADPVFLSSNRKRIGVLLPEDYELKQRITFATQTKAQVSILRRWQRSVIPTGPSSARGVGNSPSLDVV